MISDIILKNVRKTSYHSAFWLLQVKLRLFESKESHLLGSCNLTSTARKLFEKWNFECLEFLQVKPVSFQSEEKDMVIN